MRQRLIAMTQDPHPANRDWATMLLAQQEMDTTQIRHALLGACDDENDYVRGEAILGLAQRDEALALPLLQRELAKDFVTLQLFEAASIVAHPSLVPYLQAYAEPSGDDFLDKLALEALAACEQSASG